MLSARNAVLAEEISRLTTAEKLLLVEDIWEQVAAAGDALPVPAAHRAELDRRLARDADDPGRPWSAIRDELLRR